MAAIWGLCELSPGKNTKNKMKKGEPGRFLPGVDSGARVAKIWADFTWTTGAEPRDSGESRYA
jgi:hypothetical protein